MKKSTLDSITNYVNHHVHPGGFMKAVLENDLREAFGMADIENRCDMFEILSYLYSNIPAISWGSPEKVKEWLETPPGEEVLWLR